MRLSLTLVISGIAFGGLRAEPPKVDHFFPAGGQTGSTVELTLAGKPGDAVQFWTDRSELQFATGEKSEAVTVVIPESASPGIHWVRFYNDSGATDLKPFFVGRAPEFREVEPNDEVSDATAIDQTEVIVNGRLEKSGEVDVFAFQLSAGKTVVASVQANRDLGSPMDAVLQLLDERGAVLQQIDDDHGVDPQLDYDLTRDGTYFLRIFAFPTTPNSTINFAGGANYIYRMTVTTGPFVDHTLPVSVQNNVPIATRLVGWNLSAEQRALTVTADGSQSRVLDVPAAEPYLVSVVPHTVTTEDNISQESAALLTLPISVSGCLDQAREKDSYRFAGIKGQKIHFQVAARSVWSLLDPVFVLTNSDGKVIKETDDVSKTNLDVDLVQTLPADGEYIVEITDRYGHGGPRYFYELTCREAVADFALTLNSNAFVIPSEKPLEVPVTVDRQHGYAESLQVTITGLPDGVTASTETSEKEGDSSKAVTLKLSSTRTEAYSGPVTISGSSADGAKLRDATSAVAGLTATTAHLWLTVLPVEKKASE